MDWNQYFQNLQMNPLFNAGLGLLASGGPSLQPHSFGQDLVRGMQIGQDMQHRAMAMQALRNQQAEQQAAIQRAAQERQLLFGGGTVGQGGGDFATPAQAMGATQNAGMLDASNGTPGQTPMHQALPQMGQQTPQNPAMQRFLSDPRTRVMYDQQPATFWKQYSSLLNPVPPKYEYRQVGNRLLATSATDPLHPQVIYTGPQSATVGSGYKLMTPQQVQDSGLPAGTVAQLDAHGQIHVIQKGSGSQGESNAPVFGDPTLSGTDYINSIPKGNREIVQGLIDGTIALPTGSSLKSPLWQSVLASAKHADPAWNQAAYKQYADTRKYFTIGQGGQLINNVNTASYHLSKLMEDIKALHNSDFPAWNSVANLASKATGGQAVTNFNADLTPVASELAAVYKGKGVPSDPEIAQFREALSPNMSYGQQMNVIRGWIDLLSGKLNAQREQYQSSMSPLSQPLHVINPKAQQALETINNLANQVSLTGQHAMPQQDTSPIYAPGGTQAKQPVNTSGWTIQEVK